MKATFHILIVGLLGLLTSGCTSITDLSNELPYEDMVGECYVLQQDMNIIRTQGHCAAIGEEVITPYLRAYCLEDKVGELAKGSEVIISGVHIRKAIPYTCATMIFDAVDSSTLNLESLSAPLCEVVGILDWREGERRSYFRRGDTIELREDYVKPCRE